MLTPDAEQLWQTIPLDKQDLILHQVWCAHCHAITTIVEFTGRVESGDLILSGQCARCGGEVARLIETSDQHAA